MSLRQTLSLPIVLRDLVEPCLVRLMRPGELDSVRLEWRTIRCPELPDDYMVNMGPGIYSATIEPTWIEELRLVLTLTVGDESFGFDVAAEDYFPSAHDRDLSDIREALFSDLQEYIAESSFAWGQLRE